MGQLAAPDAVAGSEFLPVKTLSTAESPVYYLFIWYRQYSCTHQPAKSERLGAVH
jgi:hypothetical protein